jgi:spore germination protein YaaH
MNITRRDFVVMPPILAAAGSFVRPASKPKARRRIDTWLVYDEEKSIERIRQLGDILTSLSVFGDPPGDFIEECHRLNIEVHRAVSGKGSAFDTPARAQATIDEYVSQCRTHGYDGIDLDFEHLDPQLQSSYSDFLRKTSQALKGINRKMSHCVGYYPGMENDPPRQLFYDPKVVGETCDLVRVMCYDLYWAPGKGQGADRDDAQGIGPTSNHPWARTAMEFWLSRAPREKLVMGLPAYSNEYVLTPTGTGRQVYKPRPEAVAGSDMVRSWLWYEKVHLYLYRNASGDPHGFYASDAKSTAEHLKTVDQLDLPAIGFWHFSSVDTETWAAVREWLGA